MITDVALGGLTKAMDGLKNTIQSAFSFAMQAEKSSLALGMSFETAQNKLGGTMDGLRGDLNETFAAAVAGMEAGLQGNTAGIARLVNQQRLTGTASGKTAAAFATMEMTMGLSREATNQLASDMVEMGAEFGTSTDVLVGALNNMAKSFPAQKLAGMGTELNAAVASLQSELGKSMTGPLNNVMNMIMDTSMEGYEKLTQLGIGGVREQLAAAKSQEEAQMILKDAIATASQNFKSVVGDASKGFFQVGVAADIFGQSAMDLTTVQDAFGQRTKVEKDEIEDFGNQLGVIKSEILVPVQRAFLLLFPTIKEGAVILGSFLKEVVVQLVEKGKEFVSSFGGAEVVLATFKQTLMDAIPKVVDTITSIVSVFSNVKVVVGVLLAMSIIPLKAAFLALKPILLKVGAVFLTPFAPFIIAIGAVVAIVVLLQKKFGIFTPIIDGVKTAFANIKVALGMLIRKFGDMLGPFGKKLREMGENLSKSGEKTKEFGHVQVEATKASRRQMMEHHNQQIKKDQAIIDRVMAQREKTGDDKFGQMSINAAEKRMKARRDSLEALGRLTDAQYEAQAERRAQAEAEKQKLSGIEDAAKETAKQTSAINEKTPGEVKTQSEFLDETANMLGRSIEGILGIGKDTTNQEMLEELRVANEQRASQNNKPNERETVTSL